ncbi:putative Ig domain-containing protein [Vulgatibacter incomptus]|uniref:EF hand domain/PKD domain protein n=1 Tax=Vulgatibacter incomptus TaxID=1391653 RepID=A0A0K1PIA7_9BACT|nr:putative Ig domain-containing protein [Vulgatibacter incomptus]AKU93255.1 EF hand domain/PKD domain protein [Vulgatibacter incomptus]
MSEEGGTVGFRVQRRLFGGLLAVLLGAVISASAATAEAATEAPDLAVGALSPPRQISPGSDFELSWTALNLGDGPAIDVQYDVVISNADVLGSSSRRLHSARFTLDAFSEVDFVERLQLPALTDPHAIPPGLYYIGVIIDPNGEIAEPDKSNNTAVSPVLVASSTLSVLNQSLPPAQIGSHYCVRLDSVGGNGISVWSVAAGSRLPPGLALNDLPAKAREQGLPFVTMLCGVPTEEGRFGFTVSVTSAGLTASQGLELEVTGSGLPLMIVTKELPAATFRQAYLADLGAVGGKTPYAWSVLDGTLPSGIALRRDGTLLGQPIDDDGHKFKVLLTDAAGRTAEQELELPVTPPAKLTCTTTSLPKRGLSETYDGVVLGAAGGKKPYKWKTIDTTRLGVEIGESSIALGEVPPPGITLAESGALSGAPSQVGSYLWTVEVSDSATPAESQKCPIEVNVESDHGLTVSTQGLPAAIAGQPYRAKLQATGGQGALTWTVFSGRLPQGLNLSEDGTIDGTPTKAQLEGEERIVFSFVAEARDERMLRGLGQQSITLLAEAPPSYTPPKKGDVHCSAVSADPSLLALAAGLGLVALRRRRS